MNRIYLSWTQFDSMVRELANRIKLSRFKFDGIYGFPRGGLILAVCLSHRLNLPMVHLNHATENTLVVDDISDTGKTLKGIKNKKIATLYKTLWTKTQPDWNCEMKINKNDWIVFPWE